MRRKESLHGIKAGGKIGIPEKVEKFGSHDQQVTEGERKKERSRGIG